MLSLTYQKKDEIIIKNPKVFLNWIKTNISKEIPCKDLSNDFCDGFLLQELLQNLTFLQFILPFKKPLSTMENKMNLLMLLNIAKFQLYIPLKITPIQIVENNKKEILQMIWDLITFFRLSKKPKEIQDYQILLKSWINSIISKYGIEISNFTDNLFDGQVFAMILNHYFPDLITKTITETNIDKISIELSNEVFEKAQKVGIPQLFETKDIMNKKIGAYENMAYLAEIYHRCVTEKDFPSIIAKSLEKSSKFKIHSSYRFVSEIFSDKNQEENKINLEKKVLNQKFRSIIVQIHEKIQKEKSKINSIQKSLSQITEKNKTPISEMNMQFLETENRQLSKQLDELNKNQNENRNSYQKQITQLKNKIELLDVLLNRKEKSYTKKIRNEKQKENDEISSIQYNIQILKTEEEILRQKLTEKEEKQKDEETKQLESSIKSMDEKIGELQQNLLLSENEKEVLSQTNNRIQFNLERIQQEMKSIKDLDFEKNQTENLRKEVLILQESQDKKIMQLQSKLDNLEKEVDKIYEIQEKQKSNQLYLDFQKLKHEIKQKQDTLEKKEQKIRELEQEGQKISQTNFKGNKQIQPSFSAKRRIYRYFEH
ncbi:hypothetical protein M0811_11102 [Anaeramoeba ignava]|uniref:Calponin-homology (CH) domain-containing protein n=1 Tax=Anaeramoeba ignava TaxID=1746090 RepID=A0A9Q0R7Q1_ANAIG|nr:hypothetical protein M0811_11102 [Anaeramoeba ignava]